VSQITKRPEAEVLVDTETVRALLKTQHADLADLPLSEVAAGWDNVTFRLGEAMAVRLPRRVASAAMLEREQRWLPTIANCLPVPVSRRYGLENLVTNIRFPGASCPGFRVKPRTSRL
jgi:aminoglycoside phosphotransferase (APT) family kinase protein